MEQEEDFMDSTEENDEIRDFVKDYFLEKLEEENLEIYVDYNFYSDGKHKLVIEDEEFEVNAWTKRDDLKQDIQSMIKTYKYISILNGCNEVELKTIEATSQEKAYEYLDEVKHCNEFILVLSDEQLQNLVKQVALLGNKAQN